jgi:hypothetical protein
MKKKIFNDIKIIIIILIGVTILFTLLGAMKIPIKENMEDIPKCYSDTVDTQNKDSGYASYKSHDLDYDKYILKTQVVPPKGTVCPMQISSPASNYLDSITSNSSSTSSFVSETQINSDIIETPTTMAPIMDPTMAPLPPIDFTEQNNKLDQIQGSISQLNQQKPASDTCPPCPACERCPEPAFDCKKVLNYRSPSMGQYLPLPILNDFSKF